MPHLLNSLLIRFTSRSNKLREKGIQNTFQFPQATSRVLSTPSQDNPSHSNAPGTTSVHDSHARHDEFLCEEHVCETQQLVAVGSPIQKLPVELLAEIFFRCLLTTADGCEDNYVTPDGTTAPLLLCMVCIHWRQVAMSTPALWSSFSANRTYGDVVGSDLTQLWLDCSQAHPLSFHLSIDDRDPTYSHNLLKLFLPHIDRCCDISVDLDDTVARHLLSISTAQKASLHSVTLNTYYCTDQVIEQIPGLFGSFRNIRRLSWFAKSGHTPTSLEYIQWSQLTYVALNFHLQTDDFLVILAQCSQVVEFTSSRLEISPLRMPTPTAVLPHLRSLRIQFNCGSRLSSQCCTGELLQHFTLPALRTLSVMRFNYNPVSWNPEIFEGFLARSSCRLESLTIYNNNLTEEDLIAYLCSPYLKHLKEIELSYIHMGDRTLRALTYPLDGREGGILPCLESIKLFCCSASNGLAADMIASRWTPTSDVQDRTRPALLRFVEVQFYKTGGSGSQLECHDRDIYCFEGFRANGLKIVWGGVWN